ncbi:sodium/potassium/calcium exchanger 5-like isoform X1 [Crassostrea virginica]|uniref:Sodium/potassium/calcium exchanger 3-like isoform X1 n=1 Tax=Crassostrea virginica TaxID=6565 RepID=A0A8B8BZF8_CRAVI|nr:sodium/potassium/calcium exchanger 3-like isoform X1 [Crassostrea virginica]
MENHDTYRRGVTKIQIPDAPEMFNVRGCREHKCWRGKKKSGKLICLAVLYVVFVACNVLHRVYNEINKQDGNEINEVIRVKRNANIDVQKINGSLGQGLRSDSGHKNCTTRSAEEFPGNFMTLEETRDGGVFAHILIVLYVFGALAIVCDDYFCASLEVICDELNLQEDVAGATFMAAGSSAPEFFTALIGVFIAESDVGVGTIVGSAVFNILFIVGVCGLFAGMIVRLTWYPVLRDSLFYLLSVAALIITIYDNEVQWYEGLVLVTMYIVYIVLMYFNKSIEPFMEGLLKKIKSRKHARKHRHEDHNSNQTEAAKPLYYESSKNSAHGTPSPNDDETTFSIKKDEEECSSSEDKSSEGDEKDYHPAEGHKDSKEYESPWQIPDTFLKRVFWVSMIPMHALFFVTIPDCRRPGKWHKTYPITFVMSIAWIAGLSYIMVWMVTVAGDALEIPETVMGLTLLAAGTSVPDCLSSLFVARDGLGDMAVSNSIGSNVFDILMCLGLPWLLKSLILESGEPIPIQSEGLTYSAITLLSTVVFLLVAMFFTKWRLDKKFGVVCLLVYVVVIIFSCLYELNVFGNFNVSNYCPRE